MSYKAPPPSPPSNRALIAMIYMIVLGGVLIAVAS